MFKEFSDVELFIKEQNIQMVDLKYADLLGRWHHVTISANNFDLNLMTSGVSFDGSSVGFKNIKSGDMSLITDLTTGFVDPFWDIPTLSFLCQNFDGDSKKLLKETREKLHPEPSHISNQLG
ncbi:MAG: glutamine synthetase [Anaerolineaceae bacterium]|nr:glutamine synthetase [Anaerolineaceae bacterium]